MLIAAAEPSPANTLRLNELPERAILQAKTGRSVGRNGPFRATGEAVLRHGLPQAARSSGAGRPVVAYLQPARQRAGT